MVVVIVFMLDDELEEPLDVDHRAPLEGLSLSGCVAGCVEESGNYERWRSFWEVLEGVEDCRRYWKVVEDIGRL